MAFLFMIGKEHNYITSKAFLISSQINFKNEDYVALGELYAKAYKARFGKEPEQVLTVNSRKDDRINRIKPCSLYPVSFIPTMEEITINYYARVVE